MEHTALITPAAMRTLSRPEPPPDLHRRIVAIICAEAARQRRRRRIYRAAIGAIAVLTLVALQHGAVR